MIPRRAYFYWTGAPMSWLREQSLVTFRRHHPDWEMFLGSPEPPVRPLPAGVQWLRDDVTRAGLPPAARSDWWRWHVLGKLGGLYADTDVLFARNVEPLLEGDFDAWLTLDGGTPYPGAPWTYQGPALGKRPSGLSIGVLAAPSAGSRFFLRAADWAGWTEDGGCYQSFGTVLLVKHWEELKAGLSLGVLPFRAFYRGSSADQVRSLWRPGVVQAREYGIHWYGGSPESRPYEFARGPEDLPDCVVRGLVAPLA